MRVNRRHQEVCVAKTELQIRLNEYQQERDIEDTEMLRAISFEAREILLGMEPKVSKAVAFSALKDLIRSHQEEKGLTDIEVLQALFTHCESILNYMLRFERHGNYDTPAGLET